MATEGGGVPTKHPVGEGCGGCSRLSDAVSAPGSTPLRYRLPWPGNTRDRSRTRRWPGWGQLEYGWPHPACLVMETLLG